MFFNQYPYMNLNDFNLDYILKTLKLLSERLENFIALNTIKYANPIQWNITKQYEANTVVIDANDGTAYLSVKPVPTGVAITNTGYWTTIFTLDLISANQNLTIRNDGGNTLATFASAVDDWLISNNILYKVIRPIAVNEAYVNGYNLTRFTVEMFIREYITNIQNMIGDLDDLSTSDKSNIVNAINSVYNIAHALEIAVGDIADLKTMNQNDLVTAINETINNYVTPQMFGAVADGTTDDSDAIQAAFDYAIDNHVNVYFPYGVYYVTKPCEIVYETSQIGNLKQAGIKIYGESVEGYFLNKVAPTILTDENFVNANRGAFHFKGLMGLTVCGLHFKSNLSWTSSTLHIGLFQEYTIGHYYELSFYGFTRGVSASHCTVLWEHIEATRCLIGMYMFSCGDSIYRDLHMNTNADASDETSDSQGVGLWLTYCGGALVSGGKFEYNRVGIRSDNSILLISDVTFDVNKICHIYADGAGMKIELSNCYLRGGGYLKYNCGIYLNNTNFLSMNNCFVEGADDNGNFGPAFGVRWAGTPAVNDDRYMLLNNVIFRGLTSNDVVGSGQNSYAHLYLSNTIITSPISFNSGDVKQASYT